MIEAEEKVKLKNIMLVLTLLQWTVGQRQLFNDRAIRTLFNQLSSREAVELPLVFER